MTLSEEHIRYLLRDVILKNKDCNLADEFCVEVNDSHIVLNYAGQFYLEELFDFSNPQLTIEDKKFLHGIATHLAKLERQNPLLVTNNSEKVEWGCIFKYTHYFVNEHYFSSPIKTDLHGRVLFDSIHPDIQPLLQYPLLDYLHDQWLFNKFGLRVKKNRTLYLTCDYDVPDFRTSFHFLDFLRRQLVLLSKGNIKTLTSELASWIFGNTHRRFNPLFTDEMFELGLCQYRHQLPSEFSIKRCAFLLCNGQHPKYDYPRKNLSPAFVEFCLHLKSHGVELGIHPSYNTSDTPGLFSEEVMLFQELFGFLPKIARFHFLRISYPEGLKMLTDHEVLSDFSFYFTDYCAFRGCISKPFRKWAINSNQPAPIDLIPLTMMDCTFDKYMGLDFEAARARACLMAKRALMFGNTVCLLWHNTYFYRSFHEKNYQVQLFYEVMRILKYTINQIFLTEIKESSRRQLGIDAHPHSRS